MRHQGRITHWNDAKGFGFITPNGGRDQVFVHIRAFARADRRPAGSELVTYELAVDERNRARAEQVEFVDDARGIASGASAPGAARPQGAAAGSAAPPGVTSRSARPAGSVAPVRVERARRAPPRTGRRMVRGIALALAAALGVAGYLQYQQHRARTTAVDVPVVAPARMVQEIPRSEAPPPPGSVRVVPRAAPVPAAPAYVDPDPVPPVPQAKRPAAAGSLAVVPREPEKYRCDGRTHCSQMHSCEEATWFLNHCPGTKMDGDGDGIPCERQWC